MIAIISHPICLKHLNHPSIPEIPQRITVIEQALLNALKPHEYKIYQPQKASQEMLMKVHEADYIKFLFNLKIKEKQICIEPEACLNAFTQVAVLFAAGASTLAVDLVLQGEVKSAFCNIRPPGHHAESDKAMGFCFINNLAVGVAYALNQYHLKRIAIIDFDVHHGNGTEAIFNTNQHVLFCSSFQHPFYPASRYSTTNPHILNVPLPAGTDSAHYRQAIQKKWFKAIEDFRPELIFFSAGFDGHQSDNMSAFMLTNEDYAWVTQQIKKIAESTCQGRMISILEGGYDLPTLGEACVSHVKALI